MKGRPVELGASHKPGSLCCPRVVEANIEGQSTFGMDGTDDKGKETKLERLTIVEAASALR